MATNQPEPVIHDKIYFFRNLEKETLELSYETHTKELLNL